MAVPYAQLEPGFRRSLTLVRNVTQQLGLPLELWCVGSEIAEEMKRVIAPKDQLPIVDRSEESWTKIRHRLVDELSEDDMVIMLSAREEAYPGNLALTVCRASSPPAAIPTWWWLPALAEFRTPSAPNRRPSHRPIYGGGADLFPQLVLRAVQSPQWQAVSSLSDMLPLEVSSRRAIALELISDAKRESLLLTPNIVMLHAHSRDF